MIRNVVIHVTNEQPLLADLFDLPSSGDAGLVCTNLRSMDGKRPVFVDRIDSTFYFPYLVIRFLEIPPGAIDSHRAEVGVVEPSAAPGIASRGPIEPGSRLPAIVAPGGDGALDDGEDLELEIDEDFLRRIREV